jgi:predicted nucleotidyltransferase
MIKTKEELIDFLQTHKSLLRERYAVKEIAIFGSFARNEQNEKSDIDLLIELQDNVASVYDTKEKLREYLSRSFDRSVDLAREKYLKPYAKEQILKELIYV